MKKKVTGYEVVCKDVAGARTFVSHEKSEDAEIAAHSIGSRLPPSKRGWRQPEAFVYEQYSDGSQDLVYYEFFVKEPTPKPINARTFR